MKEKSLIVLYSIYYNLVVEFHFFSLGVVVTDIFFCTMNLSKSIFFYLFNVLYMCIYI